jgi:hypothetical protein
MSVAAQRTTSAISDHAGWKAWTVRAWTARRVRVLQADDPAADDPACGCTRQARAEDVRGSGPGVRLRRSQNGTRRQNVQIPKDQILQFLKDQGQDDKAGQAQQELPDQVDTDQHADQLQKLGINPQELLSKLGGGIPGL